MNKQRIRSIALWATLVFYVASTGTGFAVTHSCCAGHTHLDSPADLLISDRGCTHGQAALEHPDEHERFIPGTEPNCCCVGLFHVERTVSEHARAQSTDSQPMAAAWVMCTVATTPPHDCLLACTCSRSDGLDRLALLSIRTLPLLI